VAIDIDQLSSLPTFLLREGMAEAYKAGLIGDRVLATAITDQGLDVSLELVVQRAVGVKARLVSEDALEHGVRAYLNFGHTIGHAIEYASALSHGESVGLGMIAAAAISEKRLGFESAGVVQSTVEAMGLPTRVNGLDSTRILDLLGRDKKRDAEGIRMVLLRAIEEPTLTHVDESDIELGLASVGF
jgi:3-dehydroquinate synthetase